MKALLLAALAVGLLLAPVAVADAELEAVKKKMSEKVLTLELKETPLDEVLRILSREGGVPVVTDPKLWEKMPASRTKITMKAEKITAWKALELVLDMSGLEATAQGGALRIGERTGPPSGAVDRLHYVGDLQQVIRDFPGPELGFMPAYPRTGWGGRVPLVDRPVYGFYARPRWIHGSDWVPLGTPAYDDPPPSFGRPLYEDRDANAPFKAQPHAGGLSDPAVLVARVQARSGGDAVWERSGVGMRVVQGGFLWVRHTADVHERVKKAIADLRAGK